MNWVEYFKINNFKGVISRNEIPKKGKNIPGQCFIINLDDTKGPGTHWVAVKITANFINYFDSFGMQPPQELINLCYTFNKLSKYESNQFQDLSSVLCGYCCFYFLKEFERNNYFNVVKKIARNNYKKNKRYTINYFELKNMGFINNITGGGASGGASNSISSKIVDEIKVDVGVVETKVNSLPFDITGVKVDKNFDLNNFVVTNVPTPTASNHLANKGYVETWIKKDGVGNINAEGKKIINVVGPSSSATDGAVANKGYVDTSITTSQTFVITEAASKYFDKKTCGTMSGGINMDNQNIFGLQNQPKFGTSATSKDYVDNHVKNFFAASIVEQNGLVKDSNDKIKIDLSIARSTIAPVLPLGGVERDSFGKIKLVDAVVKSLIMMDGNYHSWSNEFIKNCAAGHCLISDNTSAKVGTYGVLSGTNAESLQY